MTLTITRDVAFSINRHAAQRCLDWHARTEGEAWTRFGYKKMPDDPASLEIEVEPTPKLYVYYKITQIDSAARQFKLSYLRRVDKRRA